MVRETLSQGEQNTLKNTHSALDGDFVTPNDEDEINLSIPGVNLYRSFVVFGSGRIKVQTYLGRDLQFEDGDLIPGVPFPLVVKKIYATDTSVAKVMVLV